MSFDLRLAHRFGQGFSMDLAILSGHRAIGLVGPSGSGKTTVLHALAGVLDVDEAHLQVDGRRLDGQPPWDRGVGLVVQDAMLFPLLDVRGNLNFGAGRGSGEVSLEQVVDLLEIWPLMDRPVRDLSGGEKQRVALGRALMSAPEVLLLDEPFAALDAPRRARMVERLAAVRETWPVPMVLVSHQPTDLQALVDEVFHLSEGRVV